MDSLKREIPSILLLQEIKLEAKESKITTKIFGKIVKVKSLVPEVAKGDLYIMEQHFLTINSFSIFFTLVLSCFKHLYIGEPG